ncbi:ubiquitin-conjugating enzyme E2-binding protein [Colletotrichum cereale]|nr:ubiquitin-conjugating enzyme E2-binding protein [Colletotrichum cereale]
MASQETPSIYAELLANIRQLSVAVSLPSPAGHHTQGLVTSDGATLQVQHAGAQTSFALPGRVQTQGAALPAPPPASRAISWRLPLAVDASGPSSPTTTRSPHDEPVPWTALDLAPGSAVACRACAAPLVPPGRAREWKDLPSENWAEMMDFWHCHKPTDHEHGGGEEHDHLATRRGYGANSSIAAQPGVGMVDLTSFLFSESDCTGLEFSSSPSRGAGSDATSSAVLAGGPDSPPRMLHVFCAGCGAHVGFFNVAIASVVLLKWQVSCQTAPPSSSAAAPSSSECLAAALAATLSRSGSSKSVVVPTFPSAPSSPALHLWILNSHVVYATSARRGGAARSAIKLLYREITQEEADAMLESMTSDVQEVNLPTAAIAGAAEGLRASSGLLPSGERAFKGWNVGLLDKWEPGGGRERV